MGAPEGRHLDELTLAAAVLGGGAAPRLAPIAPLVAGATGIVNVEGPVAEAAATSPGIRLHNDPRSLFALREAGVRVAGIANNHALDAGPGGPARTARALRDAGVEPAGQGAGPAVIEVSGRRVVVTAHDLPASRAALERDMTEARVRGDVLVATFHVTGAPSYLPSPELREAADVAVAAGARVVAAHGTHAVGPVERRGGAVVAWGLGNLVFECDCTREADALVLRVTIDGDRTVARVVPIEAGLLGAPPRPARDPGFAIDLLEAIGSKGLNRDRATGTACF